MDGYFYIHVFSNQTWQIILKVTKGEVSELKHIYLQIITLNNTVQIIICRCCFQFKTVYYKFNQGYFFNQLEDYYCLLFSGRGEKKKKCFFVLVFVISNVADSVC